MSTKLGPASAFMVPYAPVADPGLISNRSSYLYAYESATADTILADNRFICFVCQVSPPEMFIQRVRKLLPWPPIPARQTFTNAMSCSSPSISAIRPEMLPCVCYSPSRSVKKYMRHTESRNHCSAKEGGPRRWKEGKTLNSWVCPVTRMSTSRRLCNSARDSRSPQGTTWCPWQSPTLKPPISSTCGKKVGGA